MGLLIGSIYYNIYSLDAISPASLIVIALTIAGTSQQHRIAAVVEDRKIYYRDLASSIYGAMPYWLSAVMLEVPLVGLYSLSYCVVSYFLAGLRPGWHFAIHYFIMWLVSVACYFLSEIIAVSHATAEAGLTTYRNVIFLLILYAGYVVPCTEYPEWQRSWIQYFSILRWAFQALVLNEYQNNTEFVEADAIVSTLYSFDTISLWWCVFILVLYTGSFLLVSLLARRHCRNFEVV
jgi:hypothetical protein